MVEEEKKLEFGNAYPMPCHAISSLLSLTRLAYLEEKSPSAKCNTKFESGKRQIQPSGAEREIYFNSVLSSTVGLRREAAAEPGERASSASTAGVIGARLVGVVGGERALAGVPR